MMLNLPFKPAAVGLLLVGLSGSVIATEYNWDTQAPIKTPTPALDNGKRVLFDVSHGGTEGNADWVIDGGFSDFAYALVAEGYTVEEYRGVDLNGDGRIAFVDDYNTPANVGQNEAIISYDAISHADVLVLAETNRPFTVAEYAALKQFVDAGKGIFFIADHYDADRNLNTWDATEVYNGYNRSDLAKYNLHAQYGDMRNPKSATQGWLAEHFGLRFRFNAADYKSGVSGVVAASQSEGITAGVDPILMAAGATLAITDPTLAKGIVYFAASDNPSAWSYAKDDGLYFGGAAEGPYVAIAKPSAGKAAFIGDSSPIEDATPKYRRQDSGTDTGTDLSVIATLAQATGTDVAVRGVVVDALNGIYALLLGDLSDPSTTINIKLEADQRDSFSPNLNPDILGQTIRVVGKRDTYMSGASVEYVTTIEVVE